MNQWHFILILMLFIASFANKADQWALKQILAQNCGLISPWRYPDPPIPESIKDPVEINRIKTHRIEMDQKVVNASNAAYERYQAAMTKSNYHFRGGQVRRLSKTKLKNTKERATFALILRVYEHLRRFPFKFKEGTKVIVCKGEKTFDVYFEAHLKLGARGAVYNPYVMVNIQSGRIFRVIGG